MKKSSILFLCILFSRTLFGQSADKGITMIDLGSGLGMYHVFDNISKIPNNSGFNAGAYLHTIKGSYTTAERFSPGISFCYQDYLNDPNDTSVISVKGTGMTIAMNTDYYLCNKERFNAWVGLDLGMNFFEYNRVERDSAGNINDGIIKASGAAFGFHSGFHWYFAKYIGIFASYMWSHYPLAVRSYHLNGEEKDMIDYKNVNETIFNIRGHELRMGICLKF